MSLSREVLGLRQGADSRVSFWGAEEQMESVPNEKRTAMLRDLQPQTLLSFAALSPALRKSELLKDSKPAMLQSNSFCCQSDRCLAAVGHWLCPLLIKLLKSGSDPDSTIAVLCTCC